MQKKQAAGKYKLVTDDKSEFMSSSMHAYADSWWIVTPVPMKVKTAPKVGSSAGKLTYCQFQIFLSLMPSHE